MLFSEGFFEEDHLVNPTDEQQEAALARMRALVKKKHGEGDWAVL